MFCKNHFTLLFVKTNHFWCINTIKSLLEIYILYIFVLARRLFVKVKCFPFNKNYRIFKTLYYVIRLIFPLIKSYVKTKKLLLNLTFNWPIYCFSKKVTKKYSVTLHNYSQFIRKNKQIFI